MYSERLIEIRKTITSKEKEINVLKSEQSELWQKILREINDNTARYRKIEGLSGFKDAELGVDEEGNTIINVLFDKNSRPSATALSNFELDTGLSFKGNINSSDNYGFGL